MGDGVEHLRRERGHEQVTFDDVADHLDDFSMREPATASTIDRLAAFLAGVEDAPHAHDGEGTTVDPAAPVDAERPG